MDSTVLLDIFGADLQHGPRSREAMRNAYDSGALVVCDVVWAEVRCHFLSDRALHESMDPLGIEYEPMSEAAASLAGQLWRERRKKGRLGRERIVADFLIGAHALLQCDALITRDRGFYRTYFSNLRVIDPS